MLFKLIWYFTMSLCNFRSNWQVIENNILKLSLSPQTYNKYYDFSLYLILVVWYLTVSNLCSSLSIHWTSLPHCDGDLSTDCGFLKSTTVTLVNIRASLKTWDRGGYRSFWEWRKYVRRYSHGSSFFGLESCSRIPRKTVGSWPSSVLLPINVLNFLYPQSYTLVFFAFFICFFFKSLILHARVDKKNNKNRFSKSTILLMTIRESACICLFWDEPYWNENTLTDNISTGLFMASLLPHQRFQALFTKLCSKINLFF